MLPIATIPTCEYFDQGMQARLDGKSVRDNPYCAGSDKRQEWDAGFRAKLDIEDDDRLVLDPNENSQIRAQR